MSRWPSIESGISRRQWLRSSGLALVGASVSGWLPLLGDLEMFREFDSNADGFLDPEEVDQ